MKLAGLLHMRRPGDFCLLHRCGGARKCSQLLAISLLYYIFKMTPRVYRRFNTV